MWKFKPDIAVGQNYRVINHIVNHNIIADSPELLTFGTVGKIIKGYGGKETIWVFMPEGETRGEEYSWYLTKHDFENLELIS